MDDSPHESWVEGLDSDEEDEREEHEPPLPEWSNSYEAVPKQQGHSCIARTAFELRHVPQDVPMPMGFEYKKRRQSHPKVMKACDPQSALVLEAFLAHKCLTGLFRNSEVAKLLAAERAELQASQEQGEYDPLAAQPRAFSLTLLVHDSSLCTHRTALLDAAAYWAHYGGEERAVCACRMSILADEHARSYARNANAATRLKKASNVDLVLTAVGDEPDTTVALIAAVPAAATARQYLDILVRVASQLFVQLDREAPSSLLRHIDAEEEEHLRDAYTASIKDTTDAFWDRTLHCHPFAPIDTKLDFEDHRAFVKLVPIPRDGQPPPGHEHYTFGILTYAAGMHEQARDYCVHATRQEKHNHPQRPKNVPYGLRFPLNSAENALRMHVFEISYGFASFAREISCFAVNTAPGKPVCIYPNASVRSLHFQLAPFDEVFCRGKYVLPVTQKQLDSGNLYEHDPQWAAVELGVSRYRDAWGVESLGQDGPSHFKPRHDYRPPSREEELAASLFGVARCQSTCLSDVYARFQELGCEVPHVTRFLAAAIAKHGPGASLASALDTLTSDCQERENERKEMEQWQHRLELEKARLETLVPKKPTIASVKKELVASVMVALGRKPKKGRVIPEPVIAGAVTAVVFAYANARGIPEDKTEARWGKKNVGTLPTFDAICKVVGQLNACPTVFVRLNADESVDFLKATSEGRAAEKITLLQAMELSQSPDAAFLHFHVNNVKLSPMPRA